MNKQKKALSNEPPESRKITQKLNDVFDRLRETQLMTGFLGVATTHLGSEYSVAIQCGAELCFDLLGERFEQILDNIQTITQEVKQHESHS